jgi:ribokinase
VPSQGRTICDVVVVGGANYDYLIRGTKLPAPGETLEGEAFDEAPGGKGANQAVAVARLGSRVAFIGRIGEDARGDQLLSRLQAEGVETTHVVRDPHASTGIALIFVNARGDKQIFVVPGANRRMELTDVERAAPLIRSARVLLTQLEIPRDCTHCALNLAHVAGAKVVLDPAPAAALSPELLSLVDIIRPNAAEAATLTGVTVSNRASAREAAHALLRGGVRAAAVQAGDEGNLLVWAGGERWLPKLPVPTVDATGAGDAFAAGLAVCLAEGTPLEQAGVFANAAAALATTTVGAQAGLPRRDAVLALLRPLTHS